MTLLDGDFMDDRASSDEGVSAPFTASLALFVLDRDDARVARRVEAFQKLGLDLLCFGFTRPRAGPSARRFDFDVALGETRDGEYGRRSIALLRAMWIIWRHRDRLRGVDHCYAINFDNGILALFARLVVGKARVAGLTVEIADVQGSMLSTSAIGALLRYAERVVLRRADLLVTSSPGFVENYFVPVQRYTGEIFLLENKVPSGARHRVAPGLISRRARQPWTIGYFGAFRCPESWRMIRSIANAHHGDITFVLAGFPTFCAPSRFLDELQLTEHVSYLGKYQSPGDLRKIYSQIDLSWAFDFLDLGGNSTWCLPTRLYESGAFAVPVLTAAGTEAGAWVESHGSGWAIAGDVEEALPNFLESLTHNDYQERVAHILSLADEVFFSEDDDRRLASAMGLR